jgi:hypothetical protein
MICAAAGPASAKPKTSGTNQHTAEAPFGLFPCSPFFAVSCERVLLTLGISFSPSRCVASAGSARDTPRDKDRSNHPGIPVCVKNCFGNIFRVFGVKTFSPSRSAAPPGAGINPRHPRLESEAISFLGIRRMSKRARGHTTNLLLLVCVACGLAGCTDRADRDAIPMHMTPTYFPS